jgi:hypothetical protein
MLISLHLQYPKSNPIWSLVNLPWYHTIYIEIRGLELFRSVPLDIQCVQYFMNYLYTKYIEHITYGTGICTEVSEEILAYCGVPRPRPCSCAF